MISLVFLISLGSSSRQGQGVGHVQDSSLGVPHRRVALLQAAVIGQSQQHRDGLRLSADLVLHEHGHCSLL